MARLTVNTVETAPEKAKERIEAVQKANGFIPNLIGVLSNSPQALEMYQEVGKMNSRNSLTPEEIEVVQITTAAHNGCDFCQWRLNPCPTFSGMEGSSTWQIELNDYFVPTDSIIADPAKPFIERIRATFVLMQLGIGIGIIKGRGAI